MKKFMGLAVLAMALLVSASTLKAQDFPATEKEAVELLTGTKWKLSYMLMGEQKMDAEQMQMDFQVQFKTDNTYDMMVMGQTKPGRWTIDFANKTINIFEKDENPEMFIRIFKKDEFTAEPPETDEETPRMIFVPVKY